MTAVAKNSQRILGDKTLSNWATRVALAAAVFAAPLALWAPPAPAKQVEAAIPTPAMQRIEEVFRLFESRDYLLIAPFIKANVSPTLITNQSEQELINYIADLVRRTGGLARGPITRDGNETLGYFRSNLTGRWGVIVLSTESSSPHRISAIDVLRARPPRGTPAEPTTASEAARFARVSEFAQRLTQEGLFSGVIGIARNDRLIYHRGFGKAELAFDVPNSIHTRFSVGSIDKSFTAVAIAQLVEAGKISYEDSLSKFMKYPDSDSALKIKIKHLLSHTSGLEDYTGDKYWENVRRLRDVESHLSIMDYKPPSFEPGTSWTYSNLGFLLLGRIVEIVSGEDYYEYVQRHIFHPAGMQHAFQDFAYRPNQNSAVRYVDRFESGRFVTEYATDHYPRRPRGAPDGATVATVEDLVRFYAALRQGLLVSPATYQLMTTSKPELGARIYGYGFVTRKSEDGDRDVFGHAGDAPGICAESAHVRDLEEPYTIVVLSNRTLTCKAVFQNIVSLYSTVPTTK